jgi:hypothetical protein
VAVVLIAVGYRLYRGEGSPAAAATDIIATLPKGARIVSTAVAGEAAAADAGYQRGDRNPHLRRQTLKPAGKLRFVNEP